MVDALKIAAKVALIAVVTTAIIALFANIQIPAIDFSTFTQGVSTALAVVYHWVPVMTVIFPIALTLVSLELAIVVFQFAMIAVRWVFKVNE